MMIMTYRSNASSKSAFRCKPLMCQGTGRNPLMGPEINLLGCCQHLRKKIGSIIIENNGKQSASQLQRTSTISQNICFDCVYVFCIYVHVWTYFGLWCDYGLKMFRNDGHRIDMSNGLCIKGGIGRQHSKLSQWWPVPQNMRQVPNSHYCQTERKGCNLH